MSSAPRQPSAPGPASVPLPVETAHACYLTKESISVTEQASPEAKPVTETYARHVLHTVISTRQGDLWKRDLNEYILGDEAVVARLRGAAKISRADLQKAHEEAMAKRRVRVTLDEGTYVESDSLNTAPAQPVEAAFVPYDVPPVQYPVSVFALTWPSVTPAFPPSKPEKGSKWNGMIPVLYGACRFDVRFAVSLAEFVKDDPRMELAMEKQEISGKVNRVTLIMTPTGTWSMLIDHRDALWMEGKGTFGMQILARFRTSRDDPKDSEVRVLDLKRNFETRRLPVTFDENHLYASAWKE
jgi:hypothetical protein